MFKFIKGFLKNPVDVGAVFPSSEALAKLMTDKPNLHEAKTIAEFGCGTGIFTKRINENKKEDSIFMAFEIDPNFALITKGKCPDVLVFNDSVVNIKKYMNLYNIKQFDVIISSLPWASFDYEYQDHLLGVILDILKEEGEFLTFSYIHSIFLPSGNRFKNMVQKRFKHVETTKIVWFNAPPAFVYFCIA